MAEEKLIDVRCPFQIMDKKKNKMVDCNTLIVRVHAGSSGEAKCPKCKLSWDFDFHNQNNLRSTIQVQK